jgi:hypothetical protein
MNRIFDAFLSRQLRDGLSLAAASDLLELTPLGPEPVQRYLARFAGTTLVRGDGSDVREAEGFAVGIVFAPGYLRGVHPAEVATWLAPANVFLPNVRPPFICLGRITPGMPLVELLYQIFEIGVGAKLTVREDDALDPLACAWARRHLDRFPIDRRPLKRGAFDFDLEDTR